MIEFELIVLIAEACDIPFKDKYLDKVFVYSGFIMCL